MQKYNFVVLGSSSDLYLFSYSDLFDRSDVKYIPDIKDLLKRKYLLYRIHKHLFVKYGIGGLKYWNRWLSLDAFENDKPLCFIYLWSWVCYNDKTRIVDYFKTRYPGSKHVLFLQDITYCHDPAKETYNPVNFTKDFNLVYSFDPGDCKTYGFDYHPLVFSNYVKHNLPVTYDVYMLALAKNRLDKIYEIYDTLKASGLSVLFLLAGVPDERRINKPDIRYVDQVSYEQNLLYIEQSRCLLEIMQVNGVGYTQRGCEAVCLGKKLLTNNTHIINEKFYNPQLISVFSSDKDVDKDFLESIKKDDIVDYGSGFREAMSPLCLLKEIESRL